MFKRHNLLEINNEGREFALNQALELNQKISPELLRELIVDSKTPGIVKRQNSVREGFIEIGFSSWKYIDGRRLRAESFVPLSAVEKVITPFELMNYREDGNFILNELVKIADDLNISLGVFGSAAMQIYSKKNYMNENSDYDIYISCKKRRDIELFYENIKNNERLKNVKLDIELEIANNYSVKLIEIFSGQKTALAKGIWDARLFDIEDIINGFSYDIREIVSRNAVRALLYEVAVTPKPGLVDMNNNGSHKDMDFFRFIDSATVLTPYFAKLFDSGVKNRDKHELFEKIRYIGMTAEDAMKKATDGVNTHKGAIFSLGVFCAAVGFFYAEKNKYNTDEVFEICGSMSELMLNDELNSITLENAKTFGEFLYINHGISGIRGEVASGFKTIREIGLPILKDLLSKGYSINDASLLVLLNYIAETTDTNMIKRGGFEINEEAKWKAKDILENPYKKLIFDLDKYFIERNLSPGGCADLLSVTLMAYFMEKEAL